MDTNLDLDFNNMSKEEALAKYINNIKKLQQAALKNNINGAAFTSLVLQQFHYKNSYWTYKCHLFYKNCSRFILKFLIAYKKYFAKFLIVLITLFAIQTYKSEGQALFIRSIQNFIYPLMRFLRKISIPILYLFPNMSLLYEETCLLSNPMFQTNQVDCDACKHINIIDLSSQSQLINVYNNFPFLLHMDTNISVQHINSYIQDARIKENSAAIQSLADTFLTFLNNSNDKSDQKIWQCNTMSCARVLRKVLPRPKQIPREMSISINRFLIFDTNDWPAYKIPDGDCDMSFIFQITGSRKIVLIPNLKCVDVCKRLTINLSEKHILFYNWWYYDAISLPNVQSKLSMNYIGSYC